MQGRGETTQHVYRRSERKAENEREKERLRSRKDRIYRDWKPRILKKKKKKEKEEEEKEEIKGSRKEGIQELPPDVLFHAKSTIRALLSQERESPCDGESDCC